MKRAAFTLIELLVVIAIIGILVGLLLSAVQKVRESANRAKCQSHLKQLALGLHHYHDARNALPPGIQSRQKSSQFPAAGWQVPLLPYIEQQAIFTEAISEYQRTRNFAEVGLNTYPHTTQSHVVKLYICPSDGRVQTRHLSTTLGYFVAFTSYLGNCGTNCEVRDGVLFRDSAIAFREVRDGLTNTILLGERPPNAELELGWWYAGLGQDGQGSAEMILGVREPFTNEIGNTGNCEPRVYEFVPGQFSNLCDAFHYWSPHPGGAHFAFVDGSVRFLRYEANPIMPALATRAGGESIPTLE